MPPRYLSSPDRGACAAQTRLLPRKFPQCQSSLKQLVYSSLFPCSCSLNSILSAKARAANVVHLNCGLHSMTSTSAFVLHVLSRIAPVHTNCEMDVLALQ